MKVVAIVQARMGSSRLPGKVLMQLGETTTLAFLLKRLARASSIDEIVIATTDLNLDDKIVEHAQLQGRSFYRGSENDVLDRYVSAAQKFGADIVVRITGDCPLVDPQLVDDCVAKLLDEGLDYVSNCNNISNPLPDGFDVEVFTLSSLLLVQKISITTAYKEHVTFGYFKTGLFATGAVEYQHDLSDLRVTVDYPEDLLVVSQIATAMASDYWGWREIGQFLQSKKEVRALNNHVVRNASWDLSLGKDGRATVSKLKRDDYIANGSGLLSKRADQFSPNLWPKNYIKAKGQTIWAEENRLFLDYSIGGIGATTLGYSSEFVDDRVIAEIRNGSACSLNSHLEIEVSAKLMGLVPWIEACRFTRSGGEANTLAVRLGRAKTGKEKILFSGYHGWHDWYLAAAHEHELGNHLLEVLPIAGVPKALANTSIPFEYGNYDDFLTKLTDNRGEVAAVVLEPMRYSAPDVEFLQMLREKCTSAGIVLIFDEISCGFRFNNSAIHLDINVIPDLVIFSKAIGNGYPIACVAGTKQFMDAAKNTFISSTTHTESVGFAAMSAVLDFYSNNDVAKGLAERGKEIRRILISAAETFDLKISIKGLDQLWSWSFNCDKQTNAKLQTIVTESMIEDSILFCNRFYSTLGVDPEFYCLFEKSILKALSRVKNIIKHSHDPSIYIKGGLNRLGQY